MKISYIMSFILVLILSMGYRANQPTSVNGGYTGAPGDENCSKCHSPSSTDLEGELNIIGLPDIVQVGNTYSINVQVIRKNSDISRAGFQVVSLEDNLTNGGNFENNVEKTSVKTANGKEYFGHKPATDFDSGIDTLNFQVDWTPKPSINDGETVTFYASALLANGNGNNGGDNLLLINQSTTVNNVSNTNDIDDKKDVTFRLFPNPAQESITLVSQEKILSYQIFDSQSRLVQAQNTTQQFNEIVHLDNFKEGIYYIQVFNYSGFSQIQRLVVIK